MGKPRSITIDTRTFDKYGDANQFFSAMLNRYPMGAIVNPADSFDLAALLKRHDELADKVGVGIDHFEVGAAPDGHPGRCFWIVRTDDKRADFSFKHCLEPKPFD